MQPKKKKEISKMLQYFIVQEIVTHKNWSVGIIVRSGGGPNNIWLFDRSLHDKAECLESKYMYIFNKYFVKQWTLQQDYLILSR
jgi:hypothetical protein